MKHKTIQNQNVKKTKKSLVNFTQLSHKLVLFATHLISFICMQSVGANAQVVTTYAGNGTPGYSGDGGPAIAAQLHFPRTGRHISFSGDVYIADNANNVIRKVDHNTGIITTVAGNGTFGSGGDGGPATAAQLAQPVDVDVDAAGNIYIADRLNNKVRIVYGSGSFAGTIATFAGTGTIGFSGDGGAATAAQLFQPYGIAVRGADVYIVDMGNNRVRYVNGAGIINTYAGSGAPGWAGDGGPATAAGMNPFGLRFDLAGNLYIADFGNYVVRKIDNTSSHIISTIAGTPGTPGYTGDGGPATAATMGLVSDVSVDASNNVYIADENNGAVRLINSVTNIITTYVGGISFPIGVSNDLATGDLYIGDEFTDRILRVTSPAPLCPDQCFWKVTGNSISGGHNTLGTLTNDDINLVTGSTFRGVIQGTGNGNMGINTNSPTTFLDVDCTPPVVVAAPSGLRLENLPTGHGNVLVVDANGYVYAANSIAYRPAGTDDGNGNCCPDLQNQINILQQQVNDLKALLNNNGINTTSISNGIGGVGAINSLSVSPNPASGQANANFTIAQVYSNAQIVVSDISGKQLTSIPISGNNGTVSIALANLASGQVVCSLIVDGKLLASQKLVVMNK